MKQYVVSFGAKTDIKLFVVEYMLICVLPCYQIIHLTVKLLDFIFDRANGQCESDLSSLHFKDPVNGLRTLAGV